MKNKNNWLLAGVVILVIILLAWPAISRRNKSQDNTESPQGASSTPDLAVVGNGLGDTSTPQVVGNGVGVRAQPPVPGKVAVQVFFHDANLDPSYLNCDLVYPATRWIDPTPAIARAAISQLLGGITAAEANRGLTTALNEGTALNTLTIENGVATADFNDNLTRLVAGSCRVQAIRAQITETLKQFPSITSVVISVNGRSEDILQP